MPSASHSPACDVAIARWIAAAPNEHDARTTRIGTPGSFGRVDVPSGADESTAAAVRARRRWVRVDDMDSPSFDERALRFEDDLACSDPF